MGESHAEVTLERLTERYSVHVDEVPFVVSLRETFARPATAVGRPAVPASSGGHPDLGAGPAAAPARWPRASASPALYAHVVGLPKLGPPGGLAHRVADDLVPLQVRYRFVGDPAAAVTAVASATRPTLLNFDTAPPFGGTPD